MARIKRLLEKVLPAPRTLGDACGEESPDHGTPPDVARRRQVWTAKHQECCGAPERHEGCVRPTGQQCEEAPEADA